MNVLTPKLKRFRFFPEKKRSFQVCINSDTVGVNFHPDNAVSLIRVSNDK